MLEWKVWSQREIDQSCEGVCCASEEQVLETYEMEQSKMKQVEKTADQTVT